MVLLLNVVTLIFLFVSPLIETVWINTIQTTTMLACFVLVRASHDPGKPSVSRGMTLMTCAPQVMFVDERYRRWEAEVAIYHEKHAQPHSSPLNVQEG